jgi:aryl-alcohol dehydrogenase-like predicted oxidoreductase
MPQSKVGEAVLKTVELGRTGMRISRVGLGAWAIGGAGWWDAWGAQDDDESIATIRRAAELGINWIDTAPIYGLGHSEEVVGRALESLDPRPFVFTKAGLLDGGDGSVRNNLERDSIMREVEASLGRLRLDTIDLYQVHWPIPDERIEEAWTTFAELKEQGLVRHIGVSNFDVEQMRRAQAIAPVETLQPPYSLLERAIEPEILRFSAQQDIGVIVYSPQASGLLSGAMSAERVASLPDDDWRRHDPRFQEPELSRHLATVERLRKVGARHGTSPGAIAVAWTLHNPAVHGSIVGFRRPEQVEQLAGAGDIELTDEDLAVIHAGSIDGD